MLKFSSPKSLSAMVLSGKARSKALFNQDDFSNRNGSFQVPGGLVVKNSSFNAMAQIMNSLLPNSDLN